MVDNSKTSKNPIPGWGEFIDPHYPERGKYYPLHRGQQEILSSPARFTAAIAGTGGGKTVLGPIWCAKLIKRIQDTGKRFLGMVVAPTYKVLARATVPTLIDTFKNTALEGIWKEHKSVYEIPDKKIVDVDTGKETIIPGGLIWCQGADNPGGLEGGQFDFVWADEGGQLKLMVWIAIQGRTGHKQSPILITTTPYTKNWLYSQFYKAHLNGDPNYKVVQFSSHENPTYSKDEVDRAQRDMSSEKFEMRYHGQFMTAEGLVYPTMPDACINMAKEEYHTLLQQPGRFHGGIDFGWNDPFVALSGFLDAADVLWIWYERYKSRTPIEVHAEKIPRLSSRTIVWHTEHEPELVQKLRKGGHRIKSAKKSIIAGIDAVNARMRTGRLRFIINCCPATITEGELYSYPEDEEELGGDKPDGKNCDDHAMDALRYMVMGIDGKKAA